MRSLDDQPVITVTYSEIEAARSRAHRVDRHEWQAEVLEVLLLPQVYARWQYLNGDRFPTPTIKRHRGRSYTAFRKRTDANDRYDYRGWSEIAGYTFSYGVSGVCWNSVRDEYYAHAPSTAYDGIRRETYHEYARNLLYCNVNLDEGRSIDFLRQELLAQWKIQYIDDRNPTP